MRASHTRLWSATRSSAVGARAATETWYHGAVLTHAWSSTLPSWIVSKRRRLVVPKTCSGTLFQTQIAIMTGSRRCWPASTSTTWRSYSMAKTSQVRLTSFSWSKRKTNRIIRQRQPLSWLTRGRRSSRYLILTSSRCSRRTAVLFKQLNHPLRRFTRSSSEKSTYRS